MDIPNYILLGIFVISTSGVNIVWTLGTENFNSTSGILSTYAKSTAKNLTAIALFIKIRYETYDSYNNEPKVINLIHIFVFFTRQDIKQKHWHRLSGRSIGEYGTPVAVNP